MSEQMIGSRDARNPRIIAKLRELGVAITMEEVEQESKGPVVGRVHIAKVLVRKGYVSSIQQAFDKYLAQHTAYFDKDRLSPRQAIEMVRACGGIPVLAHPVQLCTTNDGQIDRLVKDLVDVGLAGLEVLHSDHPPDLVGKYGQLADRYGLLKTGGSDFHGIAGADVSLGFAHGQRIPRKLMDELLAASARNAG